MKLLELERIIKDLKESFDEEKVYITIDEENYLDIYFKNEDYQDFNFICKNDSEYMDEPDFNIYLDLEDSDYDDYLETKEDALENFRNSQEEIIKDLEKEIILRKKYIDKIIKKWYNNIVNKRKSIKNN